MYQTLPSALSVPAAFVTSVTDTTQQTCMYQTLPSALSVPAAFVTSVTDTTQQTCMYQTLPSALSVPAAFVTSVTDTTQQTCMYQTLPSALSVPAAFVTSVTDTTQQICIHQTSPVSAFVTSVSFPLIFKVIKFHIDHYKQNYRESENFSLLQLNWGYFPGAAGGIAQAASAQKGFREFCMVGIWVYSYLRIACF